MQKICKVYLLAQIGISKKYQDIKINFVLFLHEKKLGDIEALAICFADFFIIIYPQWKTICYTNLQQKFTNVK